MNLKTGLKGLEMIKTLKDKGLYPFFRKNSESFGTNVVCEGKKLVMLGSNNYLGLTHDPRVIEAAVVAVKKWGTGCTGSRFLNGNLEIHERFDPLHVEKWQVHCKVQTASPCR